MNQVITNLKTLFSELIRSYRSDAALNAWCNAEFEKKPRIVIGDDEEDPPELNVGDIEIHIIPGSRSRTRQMSKRSHNLTIRAYAYCINNRVPESEVPDVPETDVLVLEAVELIDTFISLVEEATIPVLQINGIAITPLDGESDKVIYPFAKAELAYLIEIPSKLP